MRIASRRYAGTGRPENSRRGLSRETFEVSKTSKVSFLLVRWYRRRPGEGCGTDRVFARCTVWGRERSFPFGQHRFNWGAGCTQMHSNLLQSAPLLFLGPWAPRTCTGARPPPSCATPLLNSHVYAPNQQFDHPPLGLPVSSSSAVMTAGVTRSNMTIRRPCPSGACCPCCRLQ